MKLPSRYSASTMPVKSTRRRSSGTRQAFASQLSMRSALRAERWLPPSLVGLLALFCACVRSRVGGLVGGRLRNRGGSSLLVAAQLLLMRRLQPADAAAGRLDLLDRALREGVRGDGQLGGELAVAE